MTPSIAACTWTAASNASFLTITSGSSGSGPGTVNFTASGNTTCGSRTGTLTVAGQTGTATQAVASLRIDQEQSTSEGDLDLAFRRHNHARHGWLISSRSFAAVSAMSAASWPVLAVWAPTTTICPPGCKVHHVAGVRDRIEAAGATLRYLPPWVRRLEALFAA